MPHYRCTIFNFKTYSYPKKIFSSRTYTLGRKWSQAWLSSAQVEYRTRTAEDLCRTRTEVDPFRTQTPEVLADGCSAVRLSSPAWARIHLSRPRLQAHLDGSLLSTTSALKREQLRLPTSLLPYPRSSQKATSAVAGFLANKDGTVQQHCCDVPFRHDHDRNIAPVCKNFVDE